MYEFLNKYLQTKLKLCCYKEKLVDVELKIKFKKF